MCHQRLQGSSRGRSDTGPSCHPCRHSSPRSSPHMQRDKRLYRQRTRYRPYSWSGSGRSRLRRGCRRHRLRLQMHEGNVTRDHPQQRLRDRPGSGLCCRRSRPACLQSWRHMCSYTHPCWRRVRCHLCSWSWRWCNRVCKRPWLSRRRRNHHCYRRRRRRQLP